MMRDRFRISMDEEVVSRLNEATTVREFVNVLNVELYAVNVDDFDLSLDMLKTFNMSELTNLGFNQEDAFKLMNAFVALQKVNGPAVAPITCPKIVMPTKKLKKAVHFTEEPPTQLIYEDLSRGEALTDRLRQLPKPNRNQLHAYPSNTILSAASLNDMRVLKQILRKNASESVRRNQKGWTPFLLAVQKGHYDVMQLLYQVGDIKFNLYTRDHHGRTPLMLAANWGHSKLLDQILRWLCQADNNRFRVLNEHLLMMDVDGQAAVHLAVLANQLTCITLLRKYGVNPMQHNGNGMSALELAIHLDRKEACDILNPRKNSNGELINVRIDKSI